MKKTLVLVSTIFIVIFHLFLPHPIQAQGVNSVGVANYLLVSGNVEDGDIISSTTTGYALSQKAYDPQIVGVVASRSAIALKAESQKNGVPVASLGLTLVKVRSENGAIKKGDFITSSSQKGVGMKAVRNGFVLGQATEDATFANASEIKLISVNLNPRVLQLSANPLDAFWQLFTIAQLAALEEPVGAFKYILSAIVLIASFGFGFLIFRRTIITGIQALGRNPLAGRMIQLSVIFNVIIVIVIILSGIGLVWMFLRL